MAVAVGHDLGEVVHMSVGSGQFGAAGQDLCELHPFVLVEAVGVASQPAGDLPEGWRYRHRGWRRAGFAERLQAAAAGLSLPRYPNALICSVRAAASVWPALNRSCR